MERLRWCLCCSQGGQGSWQAPSVEMQEEYVLFCLYIAVFWCAGKHKVFDKTMPNSLGFCDAGCIAGFYEGRFPAGHIWSALVVAVVETQHGPFKQALCDLAWGLHSSEQIKASSPLPGERSVPVPCVNRGKEIRTAEGFGS